MSPLPSAARLMLWMQAALDLIADRAKD